MLFWGDILRNHRELVGELPRRDTIPLIWHYEAPGAPEELPRPVRETLAGLGVALDSLSGFAAQVEGFAEHGLPYWVCPGTSSWNALVGRLANARANLRDAAEVGRARGASGYLVTDWGDNGHLQPPSVSFAPLLDAAGLAWNTERHRDLDLAGRLDALVFEDSAGELGRVCVEMGDLYRETGLFGYNASPLFSALLGVAPLGAIGTPDAARASAVAARAEALMEAASRARPGCADGEVVVRELRQALRLACLGAWRIARRAGGADPDDATLAAELSRAIDEQRACWLARARPGGLDDSLARLRAAAT